MSKTPEGPEGDEQPQHLPQRSHGPGGTTTTTIATTTTTAQNGDLPAVTPAEYIYRAMIPPPAKNETAEVSAAGTADPAAAPGGGARGGSRPPLSAALGKRERANTGESARCLMDSSRSLGSGGRAAAAAPMLSMDLNFLQSGDVRIDGGLAALGEGGDSVGDMISPLPSSDFVREMLGPERSTGSVGAGLPELPDPVATAAAALGVEGPPPIAECASKHSSEEGDTLCPVVQLTAKLGRISTGESIAPLAEDHRLSSQDWAKDFEGEQRGELGPMHPSLFAGDPQPHHEPLPQSRDTMSSQDWVKEFQQSGEEPEGPLRPSVFGDDATSADMRAQAQDPPDAVPSHRYTDASLDWVKDFAPPEGAARPSLFGKADADAAGGEGSISPVPLGGYDEYRVPVGGSMPPLSSNPGIPTLDPRDLPPVPPAARPPPQLAHLDPPPSSAGATSTKGKKKRRKKRVIDESRACTPTDDDVLFGRGGYTNTHQGNIRFREKALEMRPWYEQPGTTKEEKYRISDILVESVRGAGHRFLEKGSDGLWHEVVGNGARKKASQALRERVRGARGKAPAAPAAGGKSAPTASPGAKGGGGGVNAEDFAEELAPPEIDVVGV
ncbi:hypothetical protein ACHAWF_012466 [Thalassiosira exigua]